tara:strand:+ start:261 stop:806 length:546 start_codon:yes stop_codon:yes gene_type:complete
MSVLTLSSIFAATFLPSVKPRTSTFKYVGDIPPLNYFDPLKINSESNYKEERVKYWREAELQHGRVAMLGSVAMPFIELTKPGTMSIDYLSNLDSMMQSPFWLSMLVYECVRMSNGWVNPFVENGKPFTLKDSYQPGNLFSYDSDNVSETLYNNELSHGRLAMLTCAHIIGSELVTGNSIF